MLTTPVMPEPKHAGTGTPSSRCACQENVPHTLYLHQAEPLLRRDAALLPCVIPSVSGGTESRQSRQALPGVPVLLAAELMGIVASVSCCWPCCRSPHAFTGFYLCDSGLQSERVTYCHQHADVTDAAAASIGATVFVMSKGPK